MHELDDAALWREYVERDSEEAFALLVARHVNKVYSAALRHTGQSQAAEEITQTVFVILARKSRQLSPRVILSGWLYHTARLTSVTYLRGAVRRARREQEAQMQITVHENEPEAWLEIAPLLDTAMAGLNETDRHAVVLRYFDGKSLQDVGAALGSNEEAAKKRVSRALEKLRAFFTKHGVHSTTAIIANTISAHAVQPAPVALAPSVSAAVAAHGSVAAHSTLCKGTLKLMAWTKLKTTATAGIILLLAAATTVVVAHAKRPAALKTALNNAEVEKMWGEYAQAMALPGRAIDAAIPAAIQVMTTHPPMALIRQSQPRPPGSPLGRGISSVGTRFGHVAQRAPLFEVLRYAYGLDPQFPQARIIMPIELQWAAYDYIDTMPQGGPEALKKALRDQFGLVAKKEMRPDLVLILQDPALASLHQHNDAGTTNRTVNMPISKIADRLSNVLGVPVADQTGLAGGFDFTLHARSPAPEDTEAAFLQELGLKLEPSVDNHQNEFLVLEKVRP